MSTNDQCFTLGELVAMGLKVPGWLSEVAKGGQRRGFKIRTKWRKGRGPGWRVRAYLLRDVQHFLKDWENAKNYSPDKAFGVGRAQWTPEELVEADGRFSGDTLNAWHLNGCPWLNDRRKIEQVKKLALCSDGIRRCVRFYRETELQEIEAAQVAPCNDDWAGQSEANYDYHITQRVRDRFQKEAHPKLGKPLTRRLRRVRTRTARGRVTIQERPVNPRKELAKIQEDTTTAPPDPKVWMTHKEAMRDLGFERKESLSTLCKRGTVDANGKKLPLKRAQHLIDCQGFWRQVQFYDRRSVAVIVTARRARRELGPSVVIGKDEWVRLTALARDCGLSRAGLDGRMKARRPAGGWKLKPLGHRTSYRELVIHKDHVPLLLASPAPMGRDSKGRITLPVPVAVPPACFMTPAPQPQTVPSKRGPKGLPPVIRAAYKAFADGWQNAKGAVSFKEYCQRHGVTEKTGDKRIKWVRTTLSRKGRID